MKNTLKSVFITIGAIIGICLIVVGVITIYIFSSPNPVVLLLRRGFGGEVNPINVYNYQEIREEVDIHKDLTYPSQDSKNQYDVYLPKNATGKLPTVVWVHGGAFVAGSKDGIENYAVMLASEGYAVVGVDYEWAPEIKYPGQVRQIEECLKELGNVKDKYNLDLNNIILVGDSAGTHIAAQAVLLATNSAYEEVLGVNSQINSDSLKGAILYCGPYDVSKMLNTGNKTFDFFATRIGWAIFGKKEWKKGEIVKTTTIKDYATDKFPPTFIPDGNDGSFESQGRELAEDLLSKGVDVKSLFFEKEVYGNVPHEFQFNIGDKGAGAECYIQTLEFLASLDLTVSI